MVIYSLFLQVCKGISMVFGKKIIGKKVSRNSNYLNKRLDFIEEELFGGQGQPFLRLFIIAHFHEGGNILHPNFFISRRNLKEAFVNDQSFFFPAQAIE